MAKLPYLDLVNEMIAQDLIYKNKSDQFDLWLLKYSKKAMLEKVWNDATMFCRGVIVDADYNIVARPFGKFFNYEEIEDKSTIPTCGFKVYEKLDGCLAILYWAPDGKPYISTCGSMNSVQGKHGTELLRTKYADVCEKLDRSKTYLFELIYPGELHVCTYKDVDDLFLLAVIDTETGEETDISEYEWAFNCAKRFDGFTDYTKIRDAFDGTGKEGFVVRFDNGFRMKMKFEYYFRLHALKANLTPRAILEMCISDNFESYDTAVGMFDEEHQLFYNSLKNEYFAKYDEIVADAKADIAKYPEMMCMPLGEEKALFIKAHAKYPTVVFGILRDKNLKSIVWPLVKRWYKKEIVPRFMYDEEE